MVLKLMFTHQAHTVQMELRSDGCQEHLVAGAGGTLHTDQSVQGTSQEEERDVMIKYVPTRK